MNDEERVYNLAPFFASPAPANPGQTMADAEQILMLRRLADCPEHVEGCTQSPRFSWLMAYGLRRMVRRFRLCAIGHQPYVKYLVVLIALAIAFVQTSAAATRDVERVRVGYSVGGLIPFPAVVANEKKLFEPLGLELELINIRPTLAVTALVSGDLQYVIFAGTTLNAAVRGLPVKLVMVYNDRPLFSLMSRPEIHSVKDIKGKILGIASLTSGESFLSRRLLKEAGVDPEKEVTLRTIGNTPDRLVALRTGVVDATTLTVPVDIQAEKLGLRRLAFMGEVLESISGGLGVSERWIQQRPDQIKRMITGVFHGMAYARKHRPESVALVMSKWQMEPDVAEKAFDLMVKTWSENGLASDQAVQLAIEESLKITSGKQAVPVSRVVDFSFVRKVYREIKAK